MCMCMYNFIWKYVCISVRDVKWCWRAEDCRGVREVYAYVYIYIHVGYPNNYSLGRILYVHIYLYICFYEYMHVGYQSSYLLCSKREMLSPSYAYNLEPKIGYACTWIFISVYIYTYIQIYISYERFFSTSLSLTNEWVFY
jgi:hypothetical protein